MVSDKQVLANRENSLKSTGPRTKRGKAKSALNARRNGLLSKSVLLRCECPRRFQGYVTSFYDEYKPETATEVALVNMMAAAHWKLMRMSHFESVNIDAEYVKQQEPAVVPADFGAADRAGLAYREVANNSRVLDLVARKEGLLQRQFDSAFKSLFKLRASANVRAA